MVQCFAPSCKHQSESHTCRFFAFPSKSKKKSEYKRWIRLLRRKDKDPTKHSRVCSCHFKNEDKSNGPEIYEHNKHKIFDCSHVPSKKSRIRKVSNNETVDVHEAVAKYQENKELKDNVSPSGNQSTPTKLILQIENEQLKQDLSQKQVELEYKKFHYSVKNANDDVVRMETGLPSIEVFKIIVEYAERFKDSIEYYAGWKVTCIPFDDQIYITLMKIRQNYTNLHLAQLFSCSVGTISNVVTTFVNVLHEILFKDIMTTIPSSEKNSLCSPKSFNSFTGCRIVIDCTDIEISKPSLMSIQNTTYSSYRGMNSFKVIIGVAPNAVITFVSDLFPGSKSDKEIVKQSKLLDHMNPGDMILADKVFLIQDMLPVGVSVNLPPFLQHGKFTESEIKLTRRIATCRIHVERANARLKDFKILKFIPPYLRSHANVLLQLCAALVNLQYPLIKEVTENIDFDVS